MISQQFLVCDNSTLANFKTWASAVSNVIRTFGWTNSTDTGQLNGAGGGAWSGVTTTPASGAYYYEIFQPGDGLANFYLKVEYGNVITSTNAPGMRWTIGTTTNGAGTLTGFVTTLVNTGVFGNTSPSTSATYECDFSGDAGRLSILMWRNSPLSGVQTNAQVFAVQRSLNGSGSPTGTYVTLWTVGSNGGTTTASGTQQSLHFTAGPAPLFSNRSTGTPSGITAVSNNFANNSSSSAFNGGLGVAPSQPYVGMWDYPCTVIGAAYAPDLAEGVPVTVTNQYGQTITYMPSKAGSFLYAANGMAGFTAVCVEYD